VTSIYLNVTWLSCFSFHRHASYLNNFWGVGGGRKLINFPNNDKTFNVFYLCSCDYMTIILIELLDALCALCFCKATFMRCIYQIYFCDTVILLNFMVHLSASVKLVLINLLLDSRDDVLHWYICFIYQYNAQD